MVMQLTLLKYVTVWIRGKQYHFNKWMKLLRVIYLSPSPPKKEGKKKKKLLLCLHYCSFLSLWVSHNKCMFTTLLKNLIYHLAEHGQNWGFCCHSVLTVLLFKSLEVKFLYIVSFQNIVVLCCACSVNDGYFKANKQGSLMRLKGWSMFLSKYYIGTIFFRTFVLEGNITRKTNIEQDIKCENAL